MRIIDHRQFVRLHQKRRLPKWLQISGIVLGALVALFALANVVMAVAYRNKVLPNYSVAAVPIGNVAFNALDQKVSIDKVLPAQVTLKKDGQTTQIAPKDLGMTVDWSETRQKIKAAHTWLPVVSLLVHHSVPAALKLDEVKFAEASKRLEPTFTKMPLPERIVFQGDNFTIAAPEVGYKLDASAFKTSIVGQLEQGRTVLSVPANTLPAPEATGELQGELGTLQKQLDAKITLMHGTNNKQLTRADIAKFYELSGQIPTLSAAKISAVVSGVAKAWGMTAVNQNDAVSAAQYAIAKQEPVQFVLAAQGVKVHHYCTAVKGVNASVLPEFRLKLAAVYADPRGWSDGGKDTFVYVESGCDYTAWLTAPALMTTFGAICDDYYSCRVGPNVVINYDRWMGATDPWNKAGGNLENYRVMVINHETGHWLGFAHRNCTGAGQPAPVMQQQSVDLQGCTFNPWPTAAELSAL